jgi:hypothetical protein
VSYPPGQQPPTWGTQQPPAWGGPPQYSANPNTRGRNPFVVVAMFIGILVVVIGIATAVILLNQPAPPHPPCVPNLPCAPGPSLPPISGASPSPGPNESPGRLATSPPQTPLSSGPAPSTPAAPAPTATPQSTSPAVVLGGSSWRSGSLDYGFEFDGQQFNLSQSTDSLAVLNFNLYDAQVVVEATADDITPTEMIQRELAVIDGFMIGRTDDRDDYDTVLGPSIGYVSGEAQIFSGILTNSDGTPAAPGGVTILASTNGRITVAVVVIVAEPDAQFGSDTAQFMVRDTVDDIVKSFDWGSST